MLLGKLRPLLLLLLQQLKQLLQQLLPLQMQQLVCCEEPKLRLHRSSSRSPSNREKLREAALWRHAGGVAGPAAESDSRPHASAAAGAAVPNERSHKEADRLNGIEFLR